MQTLVVIFIVLLACIGVGRKLFSAFRAGGCSCCTSGRCSAPQIKEENK